MANLTEKHALVAFGANQPFGDMSPEALILAAFVQLQSLLSAKMRLSPLYRTPCFPAGSGPDYVNAAAIVTLRHNMDATMILSQLHQVEARFGRARVTRWGARTLDIDLLALDDAVLPDAATQDHWRNLAPEDQARLAPDELILPHPRLQDRAFVLVPLADIAPNWRHPLLDRTVTEMLGDLPEPSRAEVVQIRPAASS